MRTIPATVTIALSTLTLVAVSAALIPRSNAEKIGSNYTSTAPGDCRVRSRNGVDDGTIRVCPGKDDVRVIGKRRRAVELAQR